MNLAVTSPHGLAAWVGWAFGIAAPIASMFVAVVALRLARRDKAAELTREEARGLSDAALVSVAMSGRGRACAIPDRPEWWVVEATGSVTNGSSEPLVDLRITPYVHPRWVRSFRAHAQGSVRTHPHPIPHTLEPGASVTFTLDLEVRATENYEDVDRPIAIDLDEEGLFVDLGPEIRWFDPAGVPWEFVPVRGRLGRRPQASRRAR